MFPWCALISSILSRSLGKKQNLHLPADITRETEGSRAGPQSNICSKWCATGIMYSGRIYEFRFINTRSYLKKKAELEMPTYFALNLLQRNYIIHHIFLNSNPKYKFLSTLVIITTVITKYLGILNKLLEKILELLKLYPK
jgi:hypothetical protein